MKYTRTAKHIKKLKETHKRKFIARSTSVHHGKYDYSKVDYEHFDVGRVGRNDNVPKVCIICPEHGEFWQAPKHHMVGKGCQECGKRKMLESRFPGGDSSSISMAYQLEFIKRGTEIHHGKYDYSKVDYTKFDTERPDYNPKSPKICIICPRHGEFWQSPHHHMEGKGCKRCKKITLVDGACCDSWPEAYYYLKLKESKIPFSHNKRYPVTLSGKDLGYRRYDFYIPSTNEYIEVTSHVQGRETFHCHSKGLWSKYVQNIEAKKNYVEKELNAKFKFEIVNLTRQQREWMASSVSPISHRRLLKRNFRRYRRGCRSVPNQRHTLFDKI